MSTQTLSPALPTSTSSDATRAPLLVLGSRLMLFAFFQAVIAVALAATGHTDPWRSSAPWWPLSATLCNLVSIAILAVLARREGRRLTDLFNLDRRGLGRTALIFLGVLVASAPIAQIPNVGLATLLFGSPERALELFVQPIPYWAAATTLVLFPLTIALSELPTYYGYVMPRLEAAWGDGRKALLAAAAMHAAQHVTLPLIFDARFVVWRLLMFLPFALFVGFVIRRRPSLLPWLMAFHGLIDFSVAWLVFAASR